MTAADIAKFGPNSLRRAVPELFDLASRASTVEELRADLSDLCHRTEFETFDDYGGVSEGSIIRVRDAARMLRRILTRRSEDRAGFSVCQAIKDISDGISRPDLSPAFYADLYHLLVGLRGRGPGVEPAGHHLRPSLTTGREAAVERSHQLDELSARMEQHSDRYPSGLEPESVERRAQRRQRIIQQLGASEEKWYDWRWQIGHVLRDAEEITRLVDLSRQEYDAIRRARNQRVPFGVTPYYLSLMDDQPDGNRDASIRAQVFPPPAYVDELSSVDRRERECMDFMRESDTSPVDLITRRYPRICIFKPFNTCPQICVYCQRNWEIEDAMAPGAFASKAEIQAGLQWIREHPSISEVLVTGGDPLAMANANVKMILDGLAEIDSVRRIRIGSRTPVTVPMRFTEELADLLASYREPGRREIALVTHAQHVYELTPETARAAECLRLRGIPVYNQLVYTFFVSRRFEAVKLRRELASIGVDPYYTFNTKGKEETIDYRVPIARLVQEQKEEARLLPGLSRTDEAVYNVPGLGKSYLRARQHRDIIAILPHGARLYEFHPWETGISSDFTTYLAEDVPILDYLQRLEAFGEDIDDYQTIWYYF